MSEQQEQPALATGGSNKANDKSETGLETEPSVPKFIDERWKKGSWDLNMFVKDGKMDWDGLNEAGEYTVLHLKCENHQAFALYLLVLQKQKGEKFLNCIQIHLQMKNLCSLGAPLYLGRHRSKGHIFQRQSFSMVKHLSSNPHSYNLVYKLYVSPSLISSAGRAAMVLFFAAYIVDGLIWLAGRKLHLQSRTF